MRHYLGIGFALCFGFAVNSASALPLVWGNGAGAGLSLLQAFDPETGALKEEFLAPNRGQSEYFDFDVGRGIAVVGETIYHTTLGSGKIFKTNAKTKQDLGYVFDTGLWGIQSLAFDGSSFWVRNEEGFGPIKDNYLRRFAADGTLLAILPNVRGSFDIWNNRIVTSDGFYDFGGRFLRPLFDDPNMHFPGTTIAFDGTYFATMQDRGLTILDRKGNVVKHVQTEYPPTAFDDRVFTDISFARTYTYHEAVPEPGSLALLILGLIPLAMGWKRKRI